MSELRRNEPFIDKLLSASLLSVVAVLAVTCASAQNPYSNPPEVAEAKPTPVEPRARNQSTSGELPAKTAASLVEGAARAPLDRAAGQARVSKLGGFYSALRGLESRQSDRLVRVVWFGDSHVAADFWTDTLRQALQGRFGVGGPGFFHLGLKDYRHAGLSFEQQGSFGRQPSPPSLRVPFDDGNFGLGGIRTFAKSPKALVQVRPEPMVTMGPAQFRLRLLMQPSDQVSLEAGTVRKRVGGGQTSSGKAGQGGTPTGGSAQVVEAELEVSEGEVVKVTVEAGSPRLLGASMESLAPGVVLDTLGIDGARIETPLAWNREAFIEVLAQRNADLVIVSYGTNEAFDNKSPDKYQRDYAEFLARVRQAAPNADCLIIGVPDALINGERNLRVEPIGAMQEAFASESGCAFWSARAAMEPEGGFNGWLANNPKLARGDGIHLTVAGYQLLGQRLAHTLLTGYDDWLLAAP